MENSKSDSRYPQAPPHQNYAQQNHSQQGYSQQKYAQQDYYQQPSGPNEYWTTPASNYGHRNPAQVPNYTYPQPRPDPSQQYDLYSQHNVHPHPSPYSYCPQPLMQPSLYPTPQMPKVEQSPYVNYQQPQSPFPAPRTQLPLQQPQMQPATPVPHHQMLSQQLHSSQEQTRLPQLKYAVVQYLPPLRVFYDAMKNATEDVSTASYHCLSQSGTGAKDYRPNCYRCLRPKVRHPKHQSWHQCANPCGFCNRVHPFGELCNKIYATENWWDKQFHLRERFPDRSQPYKITLPAYVHIRPSQQEVSVLQEHDYIEPGYENNQSAGIPPFTPKAYALRHEMDYSDSALPPDRPLHPNRPVSVEGSAQPSVAQLQKRIRELEAELHAQCRRDWEYREQLHNYFRQKGLTDYPLYRESGPVNHKRRTGSGTPEGGRDKFRRRL